MLSRLFAGHGAKSPSRLMAQFWSRASWAYDVSPQWGYACTSDLRGTVKYRLGAVVLRAIHACLERHEFRFAPPLNQSPFVPAEAGTQGPNTQTSPSPGSPLPRGRTDYSATSKGATNLNLNAFRQFRLVARSFPNARLPC